MRLLLCCCLLLVCLPIVEGQTPADILDLSRWRLTLPIGTRKDGRPDEIRQPELSNFSHPEHFHVINPNGVVFRAHCGGVTTKGSGFPRSELREMSPDGTARANWSTDDSTTHTLILSVAITATPPKKRHVVCAQIHDADDDLMMVRLEGEKLFVERNDLGDVMLDRHYPLGTAFDLKIQAGQGHVRVFYNGEPKMDWEVSRDGCYFKAGCYTQSNLKKGDAADSFGEVVIDQLRVEN
ncbi:polysaccharide lyase family 7 protein [Rhodopirellula sp. P2]|uniref:polysaccharide lyase family 7 protein n=1 Tax=Rhodopirellula sp. P2 TaxID=2127060 RepID=UPI0023680CF2|nr:polysaccharide lyase family 7 protein [Rhodopirellula sp. P2]WDQ15197.1 polysaccharide lyase family 7 protein [Rhodopirellula sp. P2]